MAEEDDLVAWGGPGFSIRADNERFGIKAPLGTTRIDWIGVEGPFTEWSDGTVRIRMRPEYLARRGALFRFGIWSTRAMYGFYGLSLTASRYGTTAEALAAALNERLAARVGPIPSGVDPETGLRVRQATAGRFLLYQRRFVWSLLGFVLVFLVVARLIH